ncbi:MAG: ASPIC/UnbV domain-containing protein, partial [Planctomycetes bacterium]|nr:ASPIC/UnbV domain-containing protein [Planctomycetota bacterium]
FGLGQADRIAKVEVRWPCGRRQSIANVVVNRTLRITESKRDKQE